MTENRGDHAAQPQGTPAQSRPYAPRVRLSCEACRQRKARCDKLSPCTSCRRLGFVCVPVERARLPRGRTRRPPERAGQTDKELADRVAKLENLLRQVAGERDCRASVEAALSAVHTASTDTELTEEAFETQTANNKSLGDHNAQTMTAVTLPHQSRPTARYMASSFWEDIIQQVMQFALLVFKNRLISSNRHRNYARFWTVAWRTSNRGLGTPLLL